MASVSREQMEKSTSKPIGGHSTFFNGYPLAGSYRFGHIQPHFVEEVVPDDDITLSSAFKLDSYTLSQPLMQDMFLTHGYYFIPYPALLPFNYEKFITNPNIGEDIDASKVGLSYDFSQLDIVFANVMAAIDLNLEDIADPDDPSGDIDEGFSWFLRWLVLYDMIFGSGGLPASLNYKFISPDVNKALEDVLQSVRVYVADSTKGITFRYDDSQGTTGYLTFHEAIELMRDDFSRKFSVSGTSANIKAFGAFLYGLVSSFPTLPTFSSDYPINVSRILGYQMLCAHFFTNDKIDYIYSAELYRQNVYSAWLTGTYWQQHGYTDLRFSLNGESYQYDYLSAAYFCFHDFSASISSYVYPSIIGDLNRLRLIFGFNYSLRHVDYFTGSRTRPLAVGNVGVSVNNNIVDVVETIQTTWFAKFLNQVNRTGRRLAAYTKGLFPSAAISQDWHEPIWLGDITDKIGSSEVDNTAEAQQKNKNSVTSTLNSNANTKGFRYHNTQYYGVIIGVCYFDIERFYGEVTERQIFHVDRFDMFNPFLQFNGDQEVYTKELYALPNSVDTFGYQSRYLEYKQRVPQAFGAFLTDPVLSKSVFLADIEKDSVRDKTNAHISPSYIRSNPLELDRFYLSLTGLSLADYYHFQIIHWNRVKSVRPMVFNPQLG